MSWAGRDILMHDQEPTIGRSDELDGTICVVTGAGSGIGRSAARHLARDGATVVLVGRTASKLHEVKEEIDASGGMALVVPTDLAEYQDIAGLAKTTLDTYGRVDVLVNNAGYNSKSRSTLTLNPQEAETSAKVNLIAPMFLVQAFLPAMMQAGSGTIVNVASVAGPEPGLLSGPMYSAVKAGIINYTRYLNIELRNTGIRACSIIPGEVDTPFLDQRPVVPPAETRASMLTGDDVADAIVLAVASDHRVLIEDIVIKPRYKRDFSGELTDTLGT